MILRSVLVIEAIVSGEFHPLFTANGSLARAPRCFRARVDLAIRSSSVCCIFHHAPLYSALRISVPLGRRL